MVLTTSHTPRDTLSLQEASFTAVLLNMSSHKRHIVSQIVANLKSVEKSLSKNDGTLNHHVHDNNIVPENTAQTNASMKSSLETLAAVSDAILGGNGQVGDKTQQNCHENWETENYSSTEHSPVSYSYNDRMASAHSNGSVTDTKAQVEMYYEVPTPYHIGLASRYKPLQVADTESDEKSNGTNNSTTQESEEEADQYYSGYYGSNSYAYYPYGMEGQGGAYYYPYPYGGRTPDYSTYSQQDTKYTMTVHPSAASTSISASSDDQATTTNVYATNNHPSPGLNGTSAPARTDSRVYSAYHCGSPALNGTSGQSRTDNRVYRGNHRPSPTFNHSSAPVRTNGQVYPANHCPSPERNGTSVIPARNDGLIYPANHCPSPILNGTSIPARNDGRVYPENNCPSPAYNGTSILARNGGRVYPGNHRLSPALNGTSIPAKTDGRVYSVCPSPAVNGTSIPAKIDDRVYSVPPSPAVNGTSIPAKIDGRVYSVPPSPAVNGIPVRTDNRVYPVNHPAVNGSFAGFDNSNGYPAHRMSLGVHTSDVSRFGTHSLEELNAERSVKRARRNRTSFSPEQMCELEALFDSIRYPDVYRREEIANKLDLRDEVIRVWFKNRRQKLKKEFTKVNNSL